MTISALRNTVLPVMTLALAGLVRLPNQLAPRIQCSPNVHEGEKFFCSVTLEYPPDLPEYFWEKDSGDCNAETWSGQTLQLTTPLPSQSTECRLRATVRDAATGQIAGPAEFSVNVQRLDNPAPPPMPSPSTSPQVEPARPAASAEPAPRL